MEIGGYFEIELRKGNDYHPKALKLNSGRNALEYILKEKAYRKVFLPFFCCKSLLEPIQKLGLESEFYFINNHLEPIFDFLKVKKNETFIYINYFGLFDHVAENLVRKCPNLIIDNSQAFYSRPLDGVDTFYSPRKFFGVPEGAYLYINQTNSGLIKELPISKSAYRFEHLLKRIEMGAEAGYDAFKKNDYRFTGGSLKQMSLLTKRILESIDYQYVAEMRKSNFKFLNNNLESKNLLKLHFDEKTVPMVYPFLTDEPELKSKLIDKKIFIATYWPNVLEWCDSNCLEHKLAKNILHLPIDQRYGESEMKLIVKILNKYL